MISNQKNSCKGCQKRKLNCHSTCETYAQYREEIERIKKIEKDEKAYGYSSTTSWNYARARKVR